MFVDVLPRMGRNACPNRQFASFPTIPGGGRHRSPISDRLSSRGNRGLAEKEGAADTDELSLTINETAPLEAMPAGLCDRSVV